MKEWSSLEKMFHVCATCIHFHPIKQMKRMKYHCSRLGYETSPSYTFNCWKPTDTVMNLMEKRKQLWKKSDS